jgi:hypothetical protein
MMKIVIPDLIRDPLLITAENILTAMIRLPINNLFDFIISSQWIPDQVRDDDVWCRDDDVWGRDDDVWGRDDEGDGPG